MNLVITDHNDIGFLLCSLLSIFYTPNSHRRRGSTRWVNRDYTTPRIMDVVDIFPQRLQRQTAQNWLPIDDVQAAI